MERVNWKRRKTTGLIVSKSPAGKTIYGIDVSYLKDGKQKRIRESYDNKAQAVYALEKLRTLKREKKICEIEPENKILFKNFAVKFLEKHSQDLNAFKRHNCMVSMINTYFGDTALSHIKSSMITDFKNDRIRNGKAKATVNKELGFLKMMFKKAVLWDDMKENPADHVELIKKVNNTIIRYLNQHEPDERDRLLKACRESEAKHLYPIVITALYTGMRRGEIFRLKISDIDFENSFIHIMQAKNGKKRSLKMNDFLQQTLEFYINNRLNGFVFCNENGKPLTDIKRSFQNACRRASVQSFRFHDLRHTFASNLVMQGVSIYKVSKLLGHSSVQVTERYVHLAPDFSKEAIPHLNTQAQMDTKWTIVPRTSVLEQAENIENVLRN